MALLEIDGIDAFYGDFQALFGLSLAVDEGQAVAVIGANGAGKSTLLKAVAGSVPTRSGRVRYDGTDLANLPAHRRVAAGISMVPEGRRIFRSLSVEENLQVGSFCERSGPWTLLRIYEAFPMLERLAKRSAARLSGGEQQALAIGRALMNNPRLLLLDEVSLGLAPAIVKSLYAVIPIIREAGTTVLIVEQDVNQALAASDMAYCVLEGRVSLSGRPAELSRAAISAAYFGSEVHS
jgi:branched-chain amino acid transport system ATP-binding protein